MDFDLLEDLLKIRQLSTSDHWRPLPPGNGAAMEALYNDLKVVGDSTLHQLRVLYKYETVDGNLSKMKKKNEESVGGEEDNEIGEEDDNVHEKGDTRKRTITQFAKEEKGKLPGDNIGGAATKKATTKKKKTAPTKKATNNNGKGKGKGPASIGHEVTDDPDGDEYSDLALLQENIGSVDTSIPWSSRRTRSTVNYQLTCGENEDKDEDARFESPDDEEMFTVGKKRLPNDAFHPSPKKRRN